MLVSVIVPVYNAGSKLRRCLDSLVNQDHPSIEIILINDGSTDNSYEVCKEYDSKNEAIVLVNQENKGVSAVRNLGISMAKGEYITFVDSDDYVTKDYVTKDYVSYLLDLIEVSGCQVAVCAKQNMNEGEAEKDTAVGKEEKITDKEYFSRLGEGRLPRGIGVSVAAKMFHRELFKGIEFPEGKLFEDSSESYKLLLNAGTIMLSSKIKYFYVRNTESIVQKKFNIDRLQFIEAEKSMCQGILAKYPDLTEPMRLRENYALMNTLAHAVRSRDKAYLAIEKNLRKEILNNYSFVLFNKHASKKDKIGMLALGAGLKPYQIIFDIYKQSQMKK